VNTIANGVIIQYS